MTVLGNILNAKADKTLIGICIGACILLIILVIVSPQKLIYDERYHLGHVETLAGPGGLWAFLTIPSHSAVGPVYGVLHYILSPFTGLNAPYVRFVNVTMALGIVGLTSGMLSNLGYTKTIARSAAFFAIPMVWSTSGMALTEIVAAFFYDDWSVCDRAPAFFPVNGKLPGRWPADTTSVAPWLICGVFTGLAILSRQTYLPAVAFPVILAIIARRHRALAAVSFLTSLVVIAPVFYVWGGLTAPGQEFTGGGISIAHGVLSLGYLAIILTIIAPAYFSSILKRHLLIAIVAISIAFSGLMSLSHIIPMRSLFESLLPSEALGFVGFSFGVVVYLAAVSLGFATLFNCWQRLDQPGFVASTLVMGLCVATAFGVVHGFSSRYVMSSIPFLFVAVQPFLKLNMFFALRILFGALIGIGSMVTYYGFI